VVQADAGAVAMIAARVGRTRLIDNVVFDNVVFDVGDAAATGRR